MAEDGAEPVPLFCAAFSDVADLFEVGKKLGAGNFAKVIQVTLTLTLTLTLTQPHAAPANDRRVAALGLWYRVRARVRARSSARATLPRSYR
jgi:hypothetical protein